ncbi:hypothetical protein HDE_05883 [Halotydeus destructor]|nr:hypothetical protein HDE_05883 [Halotydeus destructor]
MVTVMQTVQGLTYKVTNGSPNLTTVADKLRQLVVRSWESDFASRREPIYMIYFLEHLFHLYSVVSPVLKCLRPDLMADIYPDIAARKSLSLPMVPTFTMGQVNKVLSIETLDQLVNASGLVNHIYMSDRFDCYNRLEASARELVRRMVALWASVDVTRFQADKMAEMRQTLVCFSASSSRSSIIAVYD